jgi:hypothetical protein
MTISHLIGRQRNAPITSEDKHQPSSLLHFFTFSRSQRSGYSSLDSDPNNSRRQPFLSRASYPLLCEECEPIMASTTVRSLRVLSVISFIPGFALLIPAGTESGRILPAIGLLPLFFSSAFNAFLVSAGSYRDAEARSSPIRIHAGGDDGGESQLRPGSEERDSSFEEKHPIVVFLIDTIFAGSLVLVLVFSFIGMGWWRWMSPGVVILGTYATLPLLANL